MVALSCLTWFFIHSSRDGTPKRLLFALVLLLGMVEKASKLINLVSMERDWVPTVASENPSIMTKVPFDLTHLNTAMRRIDIVCKLCAPLAVAPIISAISPAYSVVVIGTFSLVSWGVERWCAHQVWARQPRLRAPKEGPSSDEASFQLHDLSMVEDENVGMQRQSDRTHSNQPCFLLRRTTASILILLRGSLQSNFDNLSYFFKSPLWIPALGVAMLHASVLNYGNTITTWLLNAGFSINLVTVARASGSVFEMGSTVVFPFAVSMLASSNGSGYAPVRDGPTVSSRRERTALSENEDDDDDVVVVVRRNVENVKDEEMKISSNVTDIAVAKVALWSFCSHLASLVSFGRCSISALTVRTYQHLSCATARASSPQTPLPSHTSTLLTS